MHKKLGIKILAFLAIGLFAWFFVHTIFITFSGLSDNVGKADVAVVLGNEVNSDGKPSDRLKARLDKAVYAYLLRS